ncbi:MAG: sulfatase-like hydrolase/transferase [Halobacteriaceae archaeon]
MSDTDRPNVVVVFTDQQRWDTLGCYGNPMDITPNLDAAAGRGTRFERAVSAQPVCGPTRATLQTGQYATTHGVTTNGGVLPEAPHNLARVFGRAGYRTGYVGKWHISSARRAPVPEGERGGYDHWVAADALEHTSHPYEGVLYDGDGERVDFQQYRVDALTDLAVEFIEESAGDPFFCTLSYLEPHHQNDMGRYVAPEGYAYRYRNPWVPPDLRGVPGDHHEELPDYYGICARIDECYGRVLDALEAQGVLENTVVAFVSDHGSHFRTRNHEYKRSAHDASARVPLVLRGPGFDGGGVVEEPVSLVDLPPTLLDSAGVEVPAAMEGEPLEPLVRGETNWRDGAFIQPISGEEVGRALRTEQWTYAVYAPGAEGTEGGAARYVNPEGETAQPDRYLERYLYDNRADPAQRTNLVGRSDYRDVADDLRERLLARIAAIEGYEPTIGRAEYRA